MSQNGRRDGARKVPSLNLDTLIFSTWANNYVPYMQAGCIHEIRPPFDLRSES